MTELTIEIAMSALDLPMDRNDADASTVREYLKALLMRLWIQGESFSGKRPFGNSGWEYDLYKPLVKAGLIEGKLDEDGELADFDRKAGAAIIELAIIVL